MEVPLAVLIKKFRSDCERFAHVEDAASAFLCFLNSFGESSSEATKQQELLRNIIPIFELVKRRIDDAIWTHIFGTDGVKPEFAGDDGFALARSELLTQQLAVMRAYLEKTADAEFVGDAAKLGDNDLQAIRGAAEATFNGLSDEQTIEAANVAILAINKAIPFVSGTGLIIAGFGSEDLFPTLVSFELHGMLGGSLKFVKREFVDIDRNGDRARVIPFAQREMVERFLYGLDEGLQRKITQFCKGAVPGIRRRMLEQLDMSEDELAALTLSTEQAEQAFLDGLDTQSFDAIRQESQSEIEGMVEFMPKSEMARMAEALINLTSIKRRVSRGMETVGGPIDVAIISQAEGFVWVKRKHYFPQELNSRYFDRKRANEIQGGRP